MKTPSSDSSTSTTPHDKDSVDPQKSQGLTSGSAATNVSQETVQEKTAQEFHDPLLACLLLITKLENTPCSETSLIAGLPLVDEKLTPELYVRAAERAGLDAKVKQKKLLDIPDIVLPATLILKRNRAVILRSYDADNGKATIIESKTGVEKTISLDALVLAYSGYAIYTRAAYQLDQSIVENPVNTKQEHWFWSVMKSSWKIYRDVLLASLFINLFN